MVVHSKKPSDTPTVTFKMGYRHNNASYKGNLYIAIRQLKGVTRARMAGLMGLTFEALRYRERMKQLYHLEEIKGLYEVSGLDPKSFIELLREIA